MDKKIEIISIPALNDNYIWMIRNNMCNLTAVIDPAEADPVENILYKKGWEGINVDLDNDNIDLFVRSSENELFSRAKGKFKDLIN